MKACLSSMSSSDNEWDAFVAVVSSDRAVLDVLLRGARKRHDLDHERRGETWPQAVREVVADAFSDDGVLRLLREKIKLLLPDGASQRAVRTVKRHAPSCGSKQVPAAAVGDEVVPGTHPPSAVPHTTQRRNTSSTSHDSATSLSLHGEGNLEGIDGSADKALGEDGGGDKGVNADGKGGNKRKKCHVARRSHPIPDTESKENGDRAEGTHDDVLRLSPIKDHHPSQDVGDDDHEVPPLDVGDSDGLGTRAFDGSKTYGGYSRSTDGGKALPLPNEEQDPLPVSSRNEHEEADSSRKDTSGATSTNVTATVDENTIWSAATGTLPPVHATQRSSMPRREACSTGGTSPCSADVLAERPPYEGEEHVDGKSTFCIHHPGLSSLSSERKWSAGTELIHDDEAVKQLRGQPRDSESIGEDSSQPNDENTGISTTASVVFSDDQNLSDTDTSGTFVSISGFAVGTEVGDPERTKTEVAVPAEVKAYDKDQKDTHRNSASAGALLVPYGCGAAIASPAGGSDPKARSTPALQAQSFSPDGICTDGEDEYEFTFDEDEVAVSGRKSVQFLDESLWRVHEVRASFEKHELAELFYTSAELDVMVEEAEREEALERSKGRVSCEERGHQ